MSVKYPDLSFTTYPDSEQSFPLMLNITATDAALIKQYQTAIQNEDFVSAQTYLSQIPQYVQKLLTADKLNTSFDTCVALERYFNERYSPAYIVSETQPSAQENGDYWFQIVV